MRRADRLFRIVDLLRSRRAVTAARLARELSVSLRTVYRDVRDLIRSGVPIQGAAGVGYALAKGCDLPPLMFGTGELQALFLGLSMVQAFGDGSLQGDASAVLAKVRAVLPARLQPALARMDLMAPPRSRADLSLNLGPLRQAISERRMIRFDYRDGSGKGSDRSARPLGLYFWGNAWTLLGWCELRRDFRSFRPDRMRRLRVLDETFADEEGRDLQTFLERVFAEHRAPARTE